MSVAARKNIRALLSLMKRKRYVVYEKPYQLNIVGVRKDTTTPNKFDDRLYVFWKNDKNKWEGKYFTVTTDPGTYYLRDKLLSSLGAAILKDGQYVDAYHLGLHKGQYTALTQAKPVTVIRDYNRDNVLDFNNGREQTGMFGINIHRATSSGTSNDVNNWSAGCQVFQDSQDFANFIALAQKQKALYGNKFTYTLIDERAYMRSLRRRGAYVLAGLLLVSAVWTISRTLSNKSILPKL